MDVTRVQSSAADAALYPSLRNRSATEPNQSVAQVAARPNAPTAVPTEAADVVAAREASAAAAKPHATATHPNARTTYADFRRSAKPVPAEPSVSATSAATTAASQATAVSTNVTSVQSPAVSAAEAETASVNADAAAVTAADLSQYAQSFVNRLTAGTTFSLARTLPTLFDLSA